MKNRNISLLTVVNRQQQTNNQQIPDFHRECSTKRILSREAETGLFLNSEAEGNDWLMLDRLTDPNPTTPSPERSLQSLSQTNNRHYLRL